MSIILAVMLCDSPAMLVSNYPDRVILPPNFYHCVRLIEKLISTLSSGKKLVITFSVYSSLEGLGCSRLSLEYLRKLLFFFYYIFA